MSGFFYSSLPLYHLLIDAFNFGHFNDRAPPYCLELRSNGEHNLEKSMNNDVHGMASSIFTWVIGGYQLIVTNDKNSRVIRFNSHTWQIFSFDLFRLQ